MAELTIDKRLDEIEKSLHKFESYGHLGAIREHIKQQDEAIEFAENREADLVKCLGNAESLIKQQDIVIYNFHRASDFLVKAYEKQDWVGITGMGTLRQARNKAERLCGKERFE